MSKEQIEKAHREKEVKFVLDKIIAKIAGEDDMQKELTIDQRIAKLEVKEVLNDLVNKVSTNYLEQSVLGFNEAVQGYVGQVNQSSKD